MQKDNTIKRVLRHLQNKFGSTNIIVLDHWDADLCAVGVADKLKKHLVYISTYNKPDNYFFVSLERANNSGEYDTVDNLDNVTLKGLEIIVAKHLQIGQ